MMKKSFLPLASLFFLASCFSHYDDPDQGQVIFHWGRAGTGIQKFVEDHSECMRYAEPTKFFPDFSSWFYSEAAKYNIRADGTPAKGFGLHMFHIPEPNR